jgi:ribosomal-protein-serine acetyltransferase
MRSLLIARVDDIELRVFELKDAAALEGLKRDYTSYMNEWIYRGTAQEFITEALDRYYNNAGFWAGVWWRGQLAGAIGLNEVMPRTRSAGIDYMLGTSFRGQGTMTSAVKLLVDYCFNELRYNRIEIHVDEENVKSSAIPKRLGFKKEGSLRQKIFYGNSYGDLAIYAVLASDWPACIGTRASEATQSQR